MHPNTEPSQDLGARLNCAAEEWRLGIYAQDENAKVREAMVRPNPAKGRYVGRYVAIAAKGEMAHALFCSEFDTRTNELRITARDLPEPMAFEALPEPFRTLATLKGDGFVKIDGDGFQTQTADEEEG